VLVAANGAGREQGSVMRLQFGVVVHV
jgi:hypothetical protein